MSRKDKFVELLCQMCDDDSHGYDQEHRWYPDFDCSSLMYWCANKAGYDVPIYSGYTGTMLRDFTKAGFTAVPYLDQNLWDIPAGCIMLQVGMHTEGVIRAGQWGGAHINERGGVTGGETGDQTGKEVSRCNPYHYAPYPQDWDYILYPPAEGGEPEPSPEPDVDNDGIVYEVHTVDGWLGEVWKCDDTEQGYAGWRGKPIDGIRAYRLDGKPLKIQTHMDGKWHPWTTFNGSMWGENSDGDGYAGDINNPFGKPIDAIRVQGAKVRVACGGDYFGWYEYGKPTPEGDDFAGDYGFGITKVQMKA